jgi:glucokinase
LDATPTIALGVDIGGTKVAAGLVDSRGNILFQTRVQMAARGSAAEGVRAVQSAIEGVFSARPEAQSSLTGIGICAPGPLDPVTGVILNPPNVPCWRNFPLAAEVQRITGISARLDNDGNAAALAEALWGAGVGYRNVFYATLGTGIGAGIIFDGRIYHGRTGSAAEGVGASRRCAPVQRSREEPGSDFWLCIRPDQLHLSRHGPNRKCLP